MYINISFPDATFDKKNIFLFWSFNLYQIILSKVLNIYNQLIIRQYANNQIAFSYRKSLRNDLKLTILNINAITCIFGHHTFLRILTPSGCNSIIRLRILLELFLRHDAFNALKSKNKS